MRNNIKMLSLVLLATILLIIMQTVSAAQACKPKEPTVVFSCLTGGQNFLTWNTLMAPPQPIVVDEQIVHIEPYIGPATGLIACVGSAWVAPPEGELYVAEPGSVRCTGFLVTRWAQNDDSYKLIISFHSTEQTWGGFIPEYDYFGIGQVHEGEDPSSWDLVMEFKGTLVENGDRQQISGIAILTVASGEYDPTGVIPQDTKYISFSFFMDLGDDVWLPVSVTWVDQELTLPWDPLREGWPPPPDWFNPGPVEGAGVFCHHVWLLDP